MKLTFVGAFGIQAHATLADFVRHALLHQFERDRLGTLREHVQQHVVVRGRRAVQYRADETRLEFAQAMHHVGGHLTLRVERLDMRLAAEQSLILAQGVFDFGVARQHRPVDDAEAFGRLAFGEQKIAHAMLGHHARRFLREGAAQAEVAVDAESLARLQVRLADAREAVRAFGASLEGSGRSLESAQAEAATVLRDLSEGARAWTRKARGLTTEPLPPAR